MEEVDKYRIRVNLVKLIEETHFDSLVNSIARLDKKGTVPTRLMEAWKSRRICNELQVKERNSKFYDEIQRRGPQAFQLLLDSLQNSGQQNLAELLDPTLRKQESDNEEVLTKAKYLDEGTHYVYIDDFWQAENCFHDRQAIKQFFEEHCYTTFEDFSEVEGANDVGSLVVVNFCCMSNGGDQRERDWIYEKFNKTCLQAKPKILLSLRYLGVKPKREVQQDSGRIGTMRTVFSDTLQVKISLDASKKKEGEKSEEVKLLLNVLSEDNHLHFEEKIRKLQGEYKRNKLHPLECVDTYFCKAFSVKKC